MLGELLVIDRDEQQAVSPTGVTPEHLFTPPRVELVRREHDQLLRSRHALAAYARCTGEFLEDWARRAPERPFLLERDGRDWRGLSYGETLEQVRRVGAWLLGRELSVE